MGDSTSLNIRLLWLFGGYGSEKRILIFNVKDQTFQELSSLLNVGRKTHRCALIPDTNKVMLTGGSDDDDYLSSTEIIDTEDGSVTMAGPMNSKRAWHGMGVATINGKDRLAVFGGEDRETVLDSVELYDTLTEKWEVADFKLSKSNSIFSFLTVKVEDIISKV